MNGHCLCGAISYTIDAEPTVVALCHCDDCQRQSGAAFSVNAVVPRAALSIDGTPSVYRTQGTDNGNTRERLFCGECGSPLFTMLSEQPDLAVVKSGTLDDRDALQPAVELWRDSAQRWVGTETERLRFDRDPPSLDATEPAERGAPPSAPITPLGSPLWAHPVASSRSVSRPGSSSILTRVCSRASRSRRVTESPVAVSPSIVTHQGVPISTWRR